MSTDRKFYLAVWNGEDGLTDKDAAKRYYELSVKEPDARFDGEVYRFYSELIRQYPDLDTLSDEEMESSPWAASLSVAGDHVIMAMLWDQHAEVYEFVLKLANIHGLVCFDPQAQKVHLPGSQRGKVTVEPVSAEMTATGMIPTSEFVEHELASAPIGQPQEAQPAKAAFQQTEHRAEMPPEPAEPSSLLINAPARKAYETIARMTGCRLEFEDTPELEQALAREITVRISARLTPEGRSAYLALTLISVRSRTVFRLSAPPEGGASQDWILTVSARQTAMA